MTRRVHPFSYFTARKDQTRPLKIHQRRDLGAALELLPTLHQLGYEYGEPILNFPPENPPPWPPSEDRLHIDELRKVDLSFVRSRDILLQTTRPPLHDVEQAHRKRVEPGRTDLEQRLFRVWEEYLEICSRSHVKLSSPVRVHLRAGFENRKQMAFRESTTAPYKELNALDGTGWQKPPSDHLTAAFLLRVERLWEKGPGYLGVFGIDGTSTMVWAYRLGRDFSELLSEPGFVVVEMEGAGIPSRPTDMRWARDWKIDILLRRRQ